MSEIIPTILVKSFKEVEERIKRVEDYVNWVQLDIMDGVFVNNETWPYTGGKISDLKKLNPPAGGKRVKLEAHLMVERPEEVIDDWLEVVDRIIIHFESKITNRELGIRELIKKVHNWKPAASSASRRARQNAKLLSGKKEIGLALNPETHPAVVTPFLPRTTKGRGEKNYLDLVLFMTVQPGWGGQQFKDWVLTKIKFLREKWPSGNIEVDGGVNDENIKKIVKAGANLICAGTYILKSPSPLAKGDRVEQAINNLKKYAKL